MSDWKIPTEYPDLLSSPYIAIDVETYDPNLKIKGCGGVRKDGYLLGVAIATESFNCYYPLRHPEDNCDVKKTIAWLKQQLSGNNPKVGANILYDLEWLAVSGVEVKGPKLDIQVAECLLDESAFSYSLNTLCLKYLKKTKTEQKLELAAERMGIHKSKIKENLWKMHPSDVEEYGAADAKDALDIYLIQKPLLTADELDNVFHNIEVPLVDVLLAMRFKGIPVDVEKAEKVKNDLTYKLLQNQVAVKRICGDFVDVWSGKDIAKHAEKLGLEFILTDKGNESFTSDWLEAQEHPFYKHISAIRKLDRGGSVFVEKKILDMAVDGKIYPTFRQTKNDDGGTGSGRFASSNPNMQQVPARDPEIAPLVRSLFIPEKGFPWIKGDYKQQEPRVTVHYAVKSKLPGADKALQQYIENPEMDYHQLVADMAKIDRPTAKTMNLGLAYGMGKKKMAVELGVSLNRATEIYTQYHGNVPFVKALTDKASNLAESRGYIKTIAGRRKRFNLWGPTKWTQGIVPLPKELAIIEFGYPIVRYFTYRAMNSLIQGSSADMTKLAMIEAHKEKVTPILTVHDELCWSDVEESQLKLLNECMTDCLARHSLEMVVPLLVDFSVGPSWGEARKVKV